MNVLTVAVVRAASVTQARSVKTILLTQAEQKLGTTFALTHVAGIGDDAEALQGSVSVGGATVALSGLYVLRGVIGFALIDAAAESSAPSNTALIAQAKTVLGRLP